MPEHGDDMRQRRWRGLGVLPLFGAVLGLTALILTACGDDSGNDATSTTSTTSTTAAVNGASADASLSADLAGRTFLSTSVTGHDLVTDSVIRLTFDGSRLAVSAGCNTMSTGFTVSKGTLAWTAEPPTTMMACEEDLMAQDTWISGLLTKGLPATLQDNTLTLKGADVTIELKEETNTKVVGTTWTLETLIQKDTASSLPAGVEPPTLKIADDGTAAVFTGCNTGRTTVEVTDGTLTFSPMGLTKMACGNDAAKVESAVVAVLDGEVEAEVSGETLTLIKGDQGLTFRAS